jgi:hypothetical protein
LLGDWSDYSLYCRATNLLSRRCSISRPGIEFVTMLCCGNQQRLLLERRRSQDQAARRCERDGQRRHLDPDLTPEYDLTEDDFLDEVVLEIVDQSDAYNKIQIEYLDRANNTTRRSRSLMISTTSSRSALRQQDVQQFHDICDARSPARRRSCGFSGRSSSAISIISTCRWISSGSSRWIM